MKESLFLAIACFVISFYIPLAIVALRPLGFTGGIVPMAFSVMAFGVGLWALRDYFRTRS